MRGLFVRLLKARRTQLSKMCVQQRATYIHDKPPKDKIGAVVSSKHQIVFFFRASNCSLSYFLTYIFFHCPKESVFVLTVLSSAILGPSGWILSNLDHYRGRA